VSSCILNCSNLSVEEAVRFIWDQLHQISTVDRDPSTRQPSATAELVMSVQSQPFRARMPSAFYDVDPGRPAVRHAMLQFYLHQSMNQPAGRHAHAVGQSVSSIVTSRRTRVQTVDDDT